MGFRFAILTGGSALESRLTQVRPLKSTPKAKRIDREGKPTSPKKRAPKAVKATAKTRKKQTPEARKASLRNLAKAREARGG